MKIGEFVRHCFRDAFDQNLIKVDEIKRLQDRAYSKNVFKTSDEILRFKNLSVNDENGYPRYYKENCSVTITICIPNGTKNNGITSLSG